MFLVFLGITLSASELTKEIRIEGKASYYGDKFHNRKTASGEIFNKNKMTCASNQFPLGSLLKVWRVKNGDTLSVEVKVNDRMHPKYGKKRLVDLSEAAMKKLQGRKEGVIDINIQML